MLNVFLWCLARMGLPPSSIFGVEYSYEKPSTHLDSQERDGRGREGTGKGRGCGR